MDIDFKTVGKKITNRRNSLKLTQGELAEKVDTSTTTIGSIERGEKKNGGSVDLFVKIAVALDLSLDNLFNIETIKNANSENSESAFSTIKDFVDIVANNISFGLDFSSTDYCATIGISDIGICYCIQECKKNSDTIEKLKEMIDDKEELDGVKKSLADTFDKRFTERMQISDGKIVFKPEYDLEFVMDYDSKKIIIKKPKPKELLFTDDPPF